MAPHGHDHVVADDELANAGIAAGHPSLWPGTKPDDRMSAVLDVAMRTTRPRMRRRRRSARVAQVASAFAVAPVRFATRPVTATPVVRAHVRELPGRQSVLRLLHRAVLHAAGR